MERGSEKLNLTVYGQAKGAGSKTAEVACYGKGHDRVPIRDKDGNFVLRYRHATKGTEAWMKEVAKQAAYAWRGLAPLDAALWVDLTCFEDRPSTHYFQRASGPVLRPDAPAYPHSTTTHDSGKMRRAVEDALTADRNGKWAAVWTDDKRVIDGHDRKRYCDSGDEPRAVIRVGVMVAQTVADLGIPSPAPAGQERLIAA